MSGGRALFEYHISLHHSQTTSAPANNRACLNTIYLYIILKPVVGVLAASVGLNTIYLYIILKLEDRLSAADHCLNTIYLYIILKPYCAEMY